MRQSAVQNYRVVNPQNENCPVCAALSSLYRTDGFEKEVKLSANTGQGYYRRTILKPAMEITVSDLTFYNRMMMLGRHNPLSCLSFCLGDALCWHEEGDHKEYEIAGGENYIFYGNQNDSICTYHPGQRFLGVNIQLDPPTIANLIRQCEKTFLPTRLSDGNVVFYKTGFSATVKRILYEIIHCRYRGDIKKIYLEGKTLELLAVYMNEVIMGQEAPASCAGISLTDQDSLREAKRILDKNIVCPPTIGKLARLVCLNEYKLKTGFKQLFGMPVHAYIIDQRLETARALIEDKQLSVTEAVQLVGYSDASHFAKKYREKFGSNPSGRVRWSC